MVGVLIRMKLAVLRRAATGSRASWMLTGGLLGLAAAAGTIGLATADATDLGTVLDLLAAVFAIWTVGWMLGPVVSGQPVLRAEHFALLPIPRRTLAVGLLCTAFVGITAAVTLVAFLATTVYAARLGAVPVLVALPAVVLELVFVVLLSRLTASLFGSLSRSRFGAAAGALITAAMLVVSSSGWIVFLALDAVLADGFSAGFSAAVRVLPSSWGLVAVEAAARRDAVMTVLPLLGLAALVVVLLVAWSRMLAPGRGAEQVVRGSAADRAAARSPLPGATGAVLLKELRTWWRDSLRVQNLLVPPLFAVMSCALPLLFGSASFLPFAGAVTALMGAATSANLYGQDGTALWLTLLTPGSERADVRGRQLAWLALFGPLSLGLTVLGGLAAGRPELWPAALAATVALLGAGAGLVPAVAASQLVPTPDPHRTRDTPLDHGDLAGQSFLMLLVALTAAIPALVPVIVGAVTGDPAVSWAGVPAGLVTGGLLTWLFGRIAQRTLAARGPELLFLMRAGKDAGTGQAAEHVSVLAAMPESRQRLLWTLFGLGCIALVPQSLVPMAMKLTGDVARVWFLALYLPGPWQWPVIALMFALAVLAFRAAARIYLAERRALRLRRARGDAVPAGAPTG